MEPHEARNAISALIREGGEFEKIVELLNENPDARPLLGESWIEFAGGAGRSDLVRHLYETGSSFEESNESGGALAGIVHAGDEDAVRWMLANGADPNVSSDPIMWAVSDGRLNILKLLVKHGADINVVFGLPPRTPLSQSIMFHREDITEYLRSVGAEMPPGEEPAPSPAMPEAKRQKEIVDSMTYRLDGKSSKRKLDEIIPGERRISIHQVIGNSRVIFTVGLSFEPMMVPQGMEAFRHAELVMLLPDEWPEEPEPSSHQAWPWRWLRTIAQHPIENGTWLGAPSSTFANGEPPRAIEEGLEFHGFFMRHDMAFDSFVSDDGRTIRFITVVPLYREELAIAMQPDGDMELIRRFAEHEISATLDCNRINVGLH